MTDGFIRLDARTGLTLRGGWDGVCNRGWEDTREKFWDCRGDGAGAVAGRGLGAGGRGGCGAVQGHDGEREGHVWAGGACGTCEGRRHAGGELARLLWERAAEAG